VRRIAAAAAVLALVVAGGCGGADERSGPQKLDLQIANLLPVTGFLDLFGKSGRRASDVALEEIRQAIAKAHAQHTVKMQNINYKSDPVAAVRLGTNVAKKGADCITGPWGSGHAVRVAVAVSIVKQVLQITPSASAEQVSKVKDNGYLARVVPPDKLQAIALAELLSRRLKGTRGKRVNIGAAESTYAKVLTKAFEEAWKARRGVVGTKVSYRPDQTTLAPEANRLATGPPDAWVFFDTGDGLIRIAQELAANKKAKWSPRKTFGTDSLANPRLPNFAPLVTDGLRGVAISAPTKGKSADAFDSAFKRVRGTNRQTFDAQQFDAVVLCYLSAVAAGSTEGRQMKDELQPITSAPGRKYTWLELDKAIVALEAGQDIDYEGVSGPIEMNADGDATAGVYDVWEYGDGLLKTIDQIPVPLGSGGV
jgi:ABC-type branched-subunit amino acid transport system substrate-binding protein